MSDPGTKDTAKTSGCAATLGVVFAILLFGALFMVIADSSRYIASFLPLICYAVFLLLGTLAVIGGTQTDVSKIRRMVGGRIPALILNLSYLLFTAIVFGFLCREVKLQFQGSFVATLGNSPAEWIGFGFDNFFEALFLDIPGIYDLHLSSALPATFLTKTLVFAYRVLLEFALLTIVIRFWRGNLHKMKSTIAETESSP